MRIATSTIYAQQTAAIDDQQALYAQIGQQLSTGKRLNDPSDDPTRIGQDLQLHTALDTTAQQATNVQSAVSELTTTDSALSSLTSVLQSARQLAIQGASAALTDDQRTALANQIDELVRQSIAVGNTQYGGKYVFAGTADHDRPRRCSSRATRSPACSSPATSKSRASSSTTTSSSRSRRRSKRRSTTRAPTARPTSSRR